MKNTINKTIPFKQKEEEKRISKYLKLDNNNATSAKIIRYPKYRKKKKNGIKFIKGNKPFLVVVIIALIFSFISFFNNKLMASNSTSSNTTLTSNTAESTLTSKEARNYSEIISKDIKKALKISGSYDIVTKTIHRNGNSIYARGTVSLSNEDEVYFDAILKNNNISSLVINGVEYIK